MTLWAVLVGGEVPSTADAVLKDMRGEGCQYDAVHVAHDPADDRPNPTPVLFRSREAAARLLAALLVGSGYLSDSAKEGALIVPLELSDASGAVAVEWCGEGASFFTGVFASAAAATALLGTGGDHGSYYIVRVRVVDDVKGSA